MGLCLLMASYLFDFNSEYFRRNGQRQYNINGEVEQYKISKQLSFVECSFWPNFTASTSTIISEPFVQCNANVNADQLGAWNVGQWPIRGRQSTDIEKWSLLWRIPVKVICRWFVVSEHKTDNKADTSEADGGYILRHCEFGEITRFSVYLAKVMLNSGWRR